MSRAVLLLENYFQHATGEIKEIGASSKSSATSLKSKIPRSK